MKSANFYLDAWLVAKELSRPQSAIHKISFTEYKISETDEEDSQFFAKEVQPCHTTN